LTAGLLAIEGVGHLHGWQWLFLVEGMLTVLMGIYLAIALASNPSRVSGCTMMLLW
jgi:ACS family tartrate transporter-like MFS transporter